MGGKRPDQYQIDPAEAGASDHKNLPQTGLGHSNLIDTVKLDREKVGESEHDAREGGPAPGFRPPPSKDANAPLRARETEGTTPDEPDAVDTTSDEENPPV